MSVEINKIISDIDKAMIKALNHLEAELVKIRAGKANPSMLDGIVADYYGNPTAINQIANISVLDARTISDYGPRRNEAGGSFPVGYPMEPALGA